MQDFRSMNPCWSLEMSLWAVKCAVISLLISFLNIFDMTQSRDTGRLFSGMVLPPFLKIVVMFAFFHIAGSSPLSNDLMNKSEMGVEFRSILSTSVGEIHLVPWIYQALDHTGMWPYCLVVQAQLTGMCSWISDIYLVFNKLIHSSTSLSSKRSSLLVLMLCWFLYSCLFWRDKNYLDW